VEKNLIDYDKTVIDPANDAARLYHLPTFRCPSDTGQNNFLNVDEGTGIGTYEFATANYVGVWGTTGGPDGIHTCGTLPAGQQCLSDGCFFHNSRVRRSLDTRALPGTGRRSSPAAGRTAPGGRGSSDPSSTCR